MGGDGHLVGDEDSNDGTDYDDDGWVDDVGGSDNGGSNDAFGHLVTAQPQFAWLLSLRFLCNSNTYYLLPSVLVYSIFETRQTNVTPKS